MPLGKVFDATANQVLISPVTNYYKGKAIRAGLKKQEVETQLLEEELADAPNKREAAKQAALLNAENIQSQIDERVRKGEITELELSAKALTPALTDYANEKDEAVALEGFNSSILSVIESLSKKEQKRIIEAMGPDKQFSHEEVHNIGLGVRMFTDQQGGRTAQKFIDRAGSPVQGSMDKQGNYYDSSGRQRTDITPIAPGATQTELGALTRTQVGKSVADFQDTVVGAVGSVQTGTELLKISFDTPSALGKSGALTNFANEMLATAKAIIVTAGYKEIKASDRKLQDEGPEAFNWDSLDVGRMRLTAVEAVAFKAGVYGIAFAAAVSEQGIRPTDIDIQQFIDQIAGRVTDPLSFRRTIVQFMGRQDRRLRTIANVKTIPPAAQEAAFGEWDVAYAEFLKAANPQETVPDGYTGPTAKDKDGNLLILNEDETDWILAL